MLIRWQTYGSKGGLYRGKTARIRAILSESIRVNGQSRQKFIAVIGSVVVERIDPMKDAFDQWWDKPFSDMATIPAEIHIPVMALSPEDRNDRTKVNDAVRRYQCDRRPDSASPA